MHIFISGAGPVGLSAAIALTARGHEVTIADRAPGITDEARAVGVNHNSLKLLSHCGAAAKIIERAEIVRTARIMLDDALLTHITVPGQNRPLPNLVALPQSETERILLATLTRYDVPILWQHETTALTQSNDGVTVTVTHRETGETRDVAADYVFGADGSHSAVRQLLGIDFPGRTLDGTWSVADVDCAPPWPDQALVFLTRTGTVSFFITLGEGRFRLIGNHPNVLDVARAHFPVSNIRSDGTFHVGLRAAEVLGRGRVCLGGDAAHVHSPVGGRGMNLGIGDAFAFAEAVDHKDFDKYRADRRASAHRILTWTDRAYRLITTTNPAKLALRSTVLRSAGFVSRFLG